MNKADLITWLAALPESDPRFSRVEAIRRNEEQPEPEEVWLSLKEVAGKVRKNVTWLTKLGIQRFGVRLGGRLSYRLNDVLLFLQSPACIDRIRELHEQRLRHEQSKKATAA